MTANALDEVDDRRDVQQHANPRPFMVVNQADVREAGAAANDAAVGRGLCDIVHTPQPREKHLAVFRQLGADVFGSVVGSDELTPKSGHCVGRDNVVGHLDAWTLPMALLHNSKVLFLRAVDCLWL